MEWLPLSFIHLEIYPAFELNGEARKNTYKDELVRFNRYKDIQTGGWSGLWEITSGNKSFKLCTLLMKHLGRKDHLLVAIFKLKNKCERIIINGGSEVSEVVKKNLPGDLIEFINGQSGLYVEIINSLMVMEWPYGNGIIGEKDQATDFCRYCFLMMAKWPSLFDEV